MGGSGFSAEIFNSREQLLSSDLMRAQFLASRDLQNVLADASADDVGAPLTGLSGPCTLTPSSGFTMALPAAQAMAYNPGDPSLTVDNSPYEIARWALQNLTFATPDGANPRIDLVVVTPATVSSDSQSRTVLVDPTTRAITANSVFKTATPTATVAVLTGTPAASPTPPAVPSGAFALSEVYVPAGAGSAAAFTAIPRMFRRAPFPWSTMNAVVDGFRLSWDLSADPTAASSAMSVPALLRNRVLIDGELIDAGALGVGVFPDAAGNSPFAVNASASWHKPYYVYAVGGRHAPQAALNGLGVPLPVALVESLVAPGANGHPSAVITTPRGTTTQLGAVYVGLGMVYAGTTRRLACIMDNEWTHFGGQSLTAELLSHVSGAGSLWEAFDGNAPAQVPIVARKAIVELIGPIPAHPGSVFVLPDRGDGTAPVTAWTAGGASLGQVSAQSSSSVQGVTAGVLSLPNGSATPKVWVNIGPAGPAAAGLWFMAFEHRVRRLDAVTG